MFQRNVMKVFTGQEAYFYCGSTQMRCDALRCEHFFRIHRPERGISAGGDNAGPCMCPVTGNPKAQVVALDQLVPIKIYLLYYNNYLNGNCKIEGPQEATCKSGSRTMLPL